MKHNNFPSIKVKVVRTPGFHSTVKEAGHEFTPCTFIFTDSNENWKDKAGNTTWYIRRIDSPDMVMDKECARQLGKNFKTLWARIAKLVNTGEMDKMFWKDIPVKGKPLGGKFTRYQDPNATAHDSLASIDIDF